jgi:hypothetical protein
METKLPGWLLVSAWTVPIFLIILALKDAARDEIRLWKKKRAHRKLCLELADVLMCMPIPPSREELVRTLQALRAPHQLDGNHLASELDRVGAKHMH